MTRWPVFICYRQSDGTRTAQWIYELLKGQTVQLPQQGDKPAELATLDVYLDQATPGVGDWTAVHEPYLKRARAFVMVCSPAAKLFEGASDWVHKEISWWLENRGTAPVLIDALGEQGRYVPDTIAAKWPNAQRIEIIADQRDDLEGRELEQLESRLRARLLGSITPSVESVYRQELEQEQKRSSQLSDALVAQESLSKRLKQALAVGAVLLAVAAGASIYAYIQRGNADHRAREAIEQTRIAREQKDFADKQRAEARKAQARAQALVSQQLTASGDPVSGMLLALEALPTSLGNDDRPYVAEAERALYAALHARRELAITRDDLTADGANIIVPIAGGMQIVDAFSGTATKTTLIFAGSPRQITIDPQRTRAATMSGSVVTIRGLAAGRPDVTLRGHQAPIRHVRFSRSGARVLTVSADNADNSVRIWDAESGAQLTRLEHEGTTLTTAGFGKDATLVVTGAFDGAARVWDVQNGAILVTLLGHGAPLNGVALSPGGARAATASADQTGRIWDVASGKTVAILRGHQASLMGVVFSDDGTRVMTWSWDRTARVWSADTGELLAELRGHGQPLSAAAFSPDASQVVTASNDGTLRRWSVIPDADAKELRGHEGIVASGALSADGTLAATGSWDKTVRIWSTESGATARVLAGHSELVNAVAFSPDGTQLVSAGGPAAMIWSATADAAPLVLPHRDRVSKAVFDPTGTKVLSASDDSSAMIRDARTGAELHTLTGHSGRVFSPSFSRDGRRILTVADDGTGRIWESATGRQLRPPLVHGDRVLTGAFSPDGKRVITGGTDRTAAIWDAESGERLHVLAGHEGFVVDARFSPDGRRTLTVSDDRTARLTDVATGAKTTTLDEHEGALTRGIFLHEGRRALTASSDNTARMWDVASGDEIAVLRGHTGPLWDVAAAGSETLVITTSADQTARLWRVFPDLQALIDHAHKVAPRCLRPEQRHRLSLSREIPRWCVQMRKWPYDTHHWR
jgi:WD40 repeat protein